MTKQEPLLEKDLTFHAYAAQAELTAIYPTIDAHLENGGEVDLSIVYPALKLAGEAGEVAEKVGKLIRDRAGLMDKAWRLDLAKELGDVLWYLNALALELGTDLENVARLNLEKLAARVKAGTIKGSGDER